MGSMFLLPTKSKIGKLSMELYDLNQKFDAFERQYKERKKQIFTEIKKYTDKEQLQSYGVNSGKGVFKFVPVISKEIIWDIEKLQGKVRKSLLKQFVDKTYTITDYDGLIEYLKPLGADPKILAEYLSVDRKVNKKKLDQLAAMGDIVMDDLADCYKIKVKSEYVKISEMEMPEEDGES